MNIRDAEIGDIDRIVEMLADFYSKTEHSFHIPYCRDTVAANAGVCIEHGLAVVADTSDDLVGTILAIRYPSIMNAAYFVSAELAWWVEPEYRGTSVGVKLIKSIESRVEEHGCAMLSMMLLEELNPDQVEDMYLRLGYHPAERTYLKVFI